ncbi:hypothetical protein Dimus_030344 [Dionaea muscipula]
MFVNNLCFRERLNLKEVLPTESVSNEGKITESESLESCRQEENGLAKGCPSTKLEMDTLEKGMGQTSSHTTRGRQTQSGPLIPGIVLSQSSSERSRVSERF